MDDGETAEGSRGAAADEQQREGIKMKAFLAIRAPEDDSVS